MEKGCHIYLFVTFSTSEFWQCVRRSAKADEDLKSGRSRDTRVLRRKDGVSRRSRSGKPGSFPGWRRGPKVKKTGEIQRDTESKAISHHEHRRDVRTTMESGEESAKAKANLEK
ncbi:hypothetical protein CEXT_787501 [Caerostris extrusa]|uniref:Uncharacterized protein n=1 Tax=Caerostris extrusa TaxID=172846 RepID=A0AAV4VP50_CAEEX|nr:hypothetical protein CEXT_787501 [Caerostris extrusa]